MNLRSKETKCITYLQQISLCVNYGRIANFFIMNPPSLSFIKLPDVASCVHSVNIFDYFDFHMNSLKYAP